MYERLGSPEGELAIAQAVVCFATVPKSISVYRGVAAAKKLAKQTGFLMPPAHNLNAPARLMKNLGSTERFKCDPDSPEGLSGADCFPEGMEREKVYRPTGGGYERAIRDRLIELERMRGQKREGPDGEQHGSPRWTTVPAQTA